MRLLHFNFPIWKPPHLTTKAKSWFLFSIVFLTTGLSFAQQKDIASTININSKQGIIAGTLLLADKATKPILVIFVSSVIGNNRDISGHKNSFVNFPALAERLKLCGISSFRFDNRGIEGSTGNNQTATIFTHADDVKAIYQYFKSNKKFKNFKIGLLGHSEGAASAEVAASNNKDISFLILLSAQGLSGWNFFKFQTEMYYKNLGEMIGEKKLADSLYQQNAGIQKNLYDSLNRYKDYNKIRESIKSYINLKTDSLSHSSRSEMEKLYTAWQSSQQIALKKFDPKLYLSKIKCPILSLNGDRDYSVEGITNLQEIEQVAKKSGNRHVTTKLLPNVDHYYRTLQEGPIWNLLDKKELFSSLASETICSWFENIKLDKQ
ncbi:MAG: alpha/beta hydrolase [Pedobacter sp.]|nr:alpha/beta hydrolase [Pedobacter sp.]